MEYNNKQYLKLDVSIEEIAKIKIKTNYIDRRGIEDIEIGDIKPNVLIYEVGIFYSSKKPNYENIFYSVKILITNSRGLEDGLWREIPDFVEYIIVNNEIFKNNRNKFDFIVFEKEEREKEIIEELIHEDRINEYRINGDTILDWACCLKMSDVTIIKLIDRMTTEAINYIDKYGHTSLMTTCCQGSSKDIILKLIERMNYETINMLNDDGKTALDYACKEGVDEDVVIKIMLKTTFELIIKNINDKIGDAHENGMYRVEKILKGIRSVK